MQEDQRISDFIEKHIRDHQTIQNIWDVYDSTVQNEDSYMKTKYVEVLFKIYTGAYGEGYEDGYSDLDKDKRKKRWKI